MSSLCFGVALALLAAAAPAQSPAPATPDLSGSWRLNLQRSDDAKALIAEAAGSQYVAGGGRDRLLPRGNEASEVERVEMRQWLVATAERARAEPLFVEQSARELKAGFGDEVRIFYFGREATSQDARGVKRKTRMSWKGEQLLIEETGDDKMKLSHLYTLLPGGQNLIVAYRLEGGELEKPLDLRLFFDRVPEP